MSECLSSFDLKRFVWGLLRIGYRCGKGCFFIYKIVVGARFDEKYSNEYLAIHVHYTMLVANFPTTMEITRNFTVNIHHLV